MQENPLQVDQDSTVVGSVRTLVGFEQAIKRPIPITLPKEVTAAAQVLAHKAVKNAFLEMFNVKKHTSGASHVIYRVELHRLCDQYARSLEDIHSIERDTALAVICQEVLVAEGSMKVQVVRDNTFRDKITFQVGF